jgi:hypothetical protein
LLFVDLPGFPKECCNGSKADYENCSDSGLSGDWGVFHSLRRRGRDVAGRHDRTGIGFAYDAAKEITVIGTAKGFVSRPIAGGPVGSPLLLIY